MTRLLIVLIVALTAAACTPEPRTNPLSREAARSLTFSEFDVTTTGTAFESGAARDYASRLAPELEAALGQEFRSRRGDGARMEIDIASLNVAGGRSTAFGRDQSRMTGTVRIVDSGGRVMASYQIQSLAGEAAQSRWRAVFDSATQSAEGFYRVLLRDFARSTRQQVES